MTHPFDEYPLPWSDPLMEALVSAVATSLYTTHEMVDFAQGVPLDISRIRLDGTGRTMARSMIQQAADADRMQQMLDVLATRFPRLATSIDEWRAAEPIRPAEPAATMPAATDWHGFSQDGGAERQIVEGHPTLLDVVFLAVGVLRAGSVCRLRVTIGSKRYVGTGFRIADDLILTNHHVVVSGRAPNEVRASKIAAWFDYEVDAEGELKQQVEVECDSDSVVSGEDRDWAVVRTTEPIPDRFPILSIATDVDVVKDDRVYVIQHPGGRPKMIGMHHNLVRFVDDDLIQYWTDTEGGSSGSPVFDRDWNVVALHHQWTKLDVDGLDEFRNQGQRIDRVVADILAAGVVLPPG